MQFIAKYFPEITIKTPPVRQRFSKQLQRNLRRLLTAVDADIRVRGGWDRIDIEVPGEAPEIAQEVAEVLANTPGIAYFARVTVVPLENLEALGQRVLAVWKATLGNQTFCVRAKRSGQHDFTSNDVERQVGAVLNRGCASARVKLKEPDVTVRLEVVDDHCYLLHRQIPGLGGFPMGTQDPVLSLVSGGFDSTVATYLSMKRGLRTHFCFFNLGGRAHELGVKEISYYLWRRYCASHELSFVSIPFEGVVGEILENVHPSQMGVILKRMMLRVASRIADDMGVQALVTGESVAQVSSQTLANLRVIDESTDSLVLRPLITMNKGEIIDVSRTIGTEEFAANMPEYCGVISRKPTTRASLERIRREESNFDWDRLERALRDRQVMPISGVAGDLGQGPDVELVGEVPPAAVVVDIRHPSEEERQPLSLKGVKVEKIPFYQLNTRLPEFAKDRRYLLYCDKGVMSQLHAAQLQEEGYPNVAVYRPPKTSPSDGTS